MNGGVADQIGAPLEVYANPATEFVAGFIGSPPTNFMKSGMSKSAPPGAMTLGVRPEHMRIVKLDERITGQVLYSEALGAETLVHLKLPDEALITVRQAAETDLPGEGATVGVSWDDSDQMLFDAQGRRCG